MNYCFLIILDSSIFLTIENLNIRSVLIRKMYSEVSENKFPKLFSFTLKTRIKLDGSFFGTGSYCNSTLIKYVIIGIFKI